MPQGMVRREWKDWRGNDEPMNIDAIQGRERSAVTLDVLRRGKERHTPETMEDALLESFCRPLARKFQVSRPAMRIRLEALGLLVRGNEVGLFK